MDARSVAEAQEKPPTASAFSYEPLEDDAKQIRLVEIVQQTDDCLEIRLSQHDMLSVPEYNAISYTWSDGGIIRMTDITVNGQAMRVTENCRYALEQAHSHYHQPPPTQSYFWIDSICINQNSDVEKQHQVAMMSRTYAQAARVLACVGPHRHNSGDLAKVSSMARNFCHEVSSGREILSRIEDAWFDRDDAFADFTVRQLLSAMISECWDYPPQFDLVETFFKFSERYYWTRLWIIQEVASAKELEILCGSDKFSRSDIYRLHWVVGSHLSWDKLGMWLPNGSRLYDHPDCSSFSHFKFVLSRNSMYQIPALEVLSFQNPFGCSRPEDRVYGMLSQIQWPEVGPPIQVEPIYKPSINFDLAKLFLSFPGCGRENVMGIFKALEICHDLDKIEALVVARYCTSDFQDRSEYATCQYDLEIQKYEIITKSDTNQLTTRLHRTKGATSCGSINLDVTQNVPQLLYADSEIAALLCSAAREGDIIVETPFGECFLVLRRSGDSDEYCIVGQGLLLEGYSFPKLWTDLSPRAEALMKLIERRRKSFDHYLADHVWLVCEGFEKYRQDPILCSMYLKNLYEDERALQNHKDDIQLRIERLSNIDAGLRMARELVELETMLQRGIKRGRFKFYKHKTPAPFILALEPLELLLLGCQDLEKDGSRNQRKMMQRLNTMVYGKVLGPSKSKQPFERLSWFW